RAYRTVLGWSVHHPDGMKCACVPPLRVHVFIPFGRCRARSRGIRFNCQQGSRSDRVPSEGSDARATREEESSMSDRPRIVVLGGGFGGVGAIKKLKDPRAHRLLVGKHNTPPFH